MRWNLVGALLLVASTSSGCGTAAAVRPELVSGASGPLVARPSAQLLDDGLSPFVVGWEASQLADFQAQLSLGQIVIVHFDRGLLVPLKRCSTEGTYFHQNVAVQTGVTSDRDRSSVGAGALGFGTQVASERTIAFKYAISGKLGTNREFVRRSELRGYYCDGATHFVKGAMTGAFERNGTAQGSLGATGDVAPLHVAGESRSERNESAQGGILSACLQRQNSALVGYGNMDPSASDGCNSLIRLELQPIDPSVTATVSLVGFRVSDDLDAFSLPDMKFRFETDRGRTIPTETFPDQSTWQGSIPVGAFEVVEHTFLTVQAIDDDDLEDDAVGVARLNSLELSRGGSIEKLLLADGQQVGEVTFQIDLQYGP
ncbi:MAG: hypothetical protein SFV15_17650 [Polyangiaceae bacterium]|nr:hypothetical protein [Polyangiaceae bacterium]